MPGSSPAHRRQLRGIGFAVLAVVCFAALDTSTKIASTLAPVVMVTWMRYLFQTVLTVTLLAPSRGASLWRTRQPGLQVLRGAALLVCSVLAFFSLRHLPVGEYTAIGAPGACWC